MVEINKRHYRTAFTMIELIFAIVVISIAVMSLPVMSRLTSKSIESNILQEAIFAASAELMGASAGYWDVNSMSDSEFSHISRVIDVGSTCDNYKLRAGHILQPLHRRCVDGNITAVPVLSTASSSFPNLNNAVHSREIMFTDTTSDSAGYKATYYSEVSVENKNETGANDDNVKKITVLVTDSPTGENNITRLYMYSANIGEVDYYKKRLF